MQKRTPLRLFGGKTSAQVFEGRTTGETNRRSERGAIRTRLFRALLGLPPRERGVRITVSGNEEGIRGGVVIPGA